MAITSEYRLDGFDLTDPQGRWYVASGTQLPAVPAPSLPKVNVPHRLGALPIPSVMTEGTQVTLKIVVTDYENWQRRGRAQLDENWRAFYRAAMTVWRTAELVYAPKGAPARAAVARLGASLEPVYHYEDDLIETTLVLDLPEGIWHDLNWSRGLKPGVLAPLEGGAMPITDPVVKVAAVTGRVVVTDKTSGSHLVWEGTPHNRQVLELRPGEYAARWVHDPDAELLEPTYRDAASGFWDGLDAWFPIRQEGPMKRVNGVVQQRSGFVYTPDEVRWPGLTGLIRPRRSIIAPGDGIYRIQVEVGALTGQVTCTARIYLATRPVREQQVITQVLTLKPGTVQQNVELPVNTRGKHTRLELEITGAGSVTILSVHLLKQYQDDDTDAIDPETTNGISLSPGGFRITPHPRTGVHEVTATGGKVTIDARRAY